MNARMRIAAILFCFMAPAARAAHLDHAARFAILPQQLATAVIQFSDQSGVQIVTADTEVAGRSTKGVNGTLRVEDALRQLLSGTGLSYKRVGDTAIALLRSETTSLNQDKQAAAASLMLAGAQDERRETGKKAVAAASAAEPHEIIVTGSHIRGVREVAAPSITITREEMARAGYSTLESIFEDLPQNFAEVSPDGRYIGGNSPLSRENADLASGIDLRGLGAQSTLTLLNGARRAGSVDGRVVDVSAIPLSVIEQVEVVSGGRSAIYGSDAVGGVVNLVTRRDFTGIESQASYGWAREGAEKLQLSTITGAKLARGGFVAAYDYMSTGALDLLDTDFTGPPSPIFGADLEVQLEQASQRHSLFTSGRFALSERIELHADGLYTRKEMENIGRSLRPGAPAESYVVTEISNKHLSASAGLRAELGAAWALNVTGGISTFDNAYDGLSVTNTATSTSLFISDEQTDVKLRTASAILEGPLFSLGGVTPRAALGLERRDEKLEILNNRTLQFVHAAARHVSSASAEIMVPLVSAGSTAGLRHLELSLAGRYDDYSDFGATFNPQAGFIWEFMEGVKLRGAYSNAYRAPGLYELRNVSTVLIFGFADPTVGNAQVPFLRWSGNNPNLGPEKATTWSASLDYEPAFASEARISLSYIDVRYRDRIDVPAFGADANFALERESRFPGLIDRAPTRAKINAILAVTANPQNFITNPPWNRATQHLLDAYPNLIVFDNRSNNIAVETMKGLDLLVSAQLGLFGGTANAGLNTTYTLEHERRVTATSPAFTRLNDLAKPVDLRMRANLGWSRGAYGVFAYLNYVDGYTNTASVPSARISAWTTLDASLRLDGSQLSGAGWLQDLTATLSVKNLLDRDPPLVRDTQSILLYDATNANPLGRYISVNLVKSW